MLENECSLLARKAPVVWLTVAEKSSAKIQCFNVSKNWAFPLCSLWSLWLILGLVVLTAADAAIEPIALRNRQNSAMLGRIAKNSRAESCAM
ncbi:MAG: hypothetical protein F4X02_03525 [Chloroflexi bacterium]|nr:hypothetical protein [Chloroflexota bacterium]